MKQSLRVTDVTRYASVSLKSPSAYVCHQCRQIAFASARRAQAPLPVSYIQRRFASGDNSWTERVRRRIWGTDHPPGQDDPYGPSTSRDQEKNRDATEAEPHEATPDKPTPDEPTPDQPTPDKASGIKSDKRDYVESITWDGLDRIGGQDESWEEAWDHNNPFEGFMAPTKMESREDISEAIHRALVEIFTLQEARVSMEIFMGYGETPEAHYFKDVSFKQAPGGATVPIFADEKLREEVLDSLTEVENDSATSVEAIADESQAPTADEPQPPAREEVEDLWDQKSTAREEPIFDYRPNDETWLNVSFDDRKTKFAIIKRVMQLTGVRIPDPSIDDINSAKALLGFLVKKPKPKKLAQSLMADENLKNLPNVNIMDRRYRPIDKEKQVGRWKVIEKELKRQGLPVTGGRENAWNPAKLP